MKSNILNRLIKIKVILCIITLFILLFPFNMMNISFKKYLVNSLIVLDTKMVIIAALFFIYFIIYLMVNRVIKKNNVGSNKLSLVVDEMLIDSALIILSSYGYINSLITAIVVIKHLGYNVFMNRVSSDRIYVKAESIFLILGIILKMIGNLPMGLINIALDDFFLVAGAVLCFITTMEYTILYKKIKKGN